MYGPYSAIEINGRKVINYSGNKIQKPINNISSKKFSGNIIKERLSEFSNNEAYYHLHKIDNAVFFAAINFFKKIGAEWCNLPLTTRMISSPGEIYSGKELDYTTDTAPIDISWFGNNKKIFLAESSQFYLELRLLINKIDKVFSIYNSFRKEKADFSHLSEFQHIEFEGHVNLKKNIEIAIGLLDFITQYILVNNKKNLSYFLNKSDINSLNFSFNDENIKRIRFKDALEVLYKATKNKKYKVFSLKNFHEWEEIKLTEILHGHVLLTEFPARQTSFYHNIKNGKNKMDITESVDLILYGYREVLGGGVRVFNHNMLLKKAKFFKLPLDDYLPYLEIRKIKKYKKSAGFGMGWQRYVHWLLKLPYIWESTHIPRSHLLPNP